MSSTPLFGRDRVRVKLLAFTGADASVYDRAKKKYMSLFNPEEMEFVNDKPDILMFLTGGSEHVAIESVQEYRFYLLLASREANSWAAATEVKAWMNQHNIRSLLINADDPSTIDILNDFYHSYTGIRRLHGQRLGVVGNPSPWLVASIVSPVQLHAKLGIEQVDISWNDIVFKEITQVSPDFIALFSGTQNIAELTESGKIYEGLASLVPFYQLNALAIECFTLVNQTGHTACLALAKLNYDGIPAACEADVCSAVAIMLSAEVCHSIPWMANVALVKSNSLLLTHCTVPLQQLTSFKLDTHFETNKGLAIAGQIKGDEVTIFRFDNTFNHLFITKGNVVSRPKGRAACRTQLEVEITNSASQYFLTNPFGNHHLVVPGNWTNRLKLAAKLIGIEVVE